MAREARNGFPSQYGIVRYCRPIPGLLCGYSIAALMSSSSSSFKAAQIGELRDSFAVASRVYANGSLMLAQQSSSQPIQSGSSSSSSGSEYMKPLIDEVFSCLSTKTERATCLHLLAAIIHKRCESSEHTSKMASIDGNVLTTIDGIPALIDTCASQDEADAIVDLMDALLIRSQHAFADFVSRLQTNLSRVITACTRAISSTSTVTSSVGFAVIELLAVTDSPFRSALPQQLKDCTSALMQTVSNGSNINTKSGSHPELWSHKTLAAVYSLESAEAWANTHWQFHITACMRALTELGIRVSGVDVAPTTNTNNAAGSGLKMHATEAGGKQGLSGVNKALYYERQFASHCRVLSEVRPESALAFNYLFAVLMCFCS
jgi:hypothetical protein